MPKIISLSLPLSQSINQQLSHHSYLIFISCYFFFPIGLYFYFKWLTNATIFIILYGLTGLYFAGVMVRLILVATPAVYLISAIAISISMQNLAVLIHNKPKSPYTVATKGLSNLKVSAKVLVDQALLFQRKGAGVLLFCVLYLLTSYVTYCTWVTLEVYSFSFIILAARGTHGDRVIFNDYHEAYFLTVAKYTP